RGMERRLGGSALSADSAASAAAAPAATVTDNMATSMISGVMLPPPRATTEEVLPDVATWVTPSDASVQDDRDRARAGCHESRASQSPRAANNRVCAHFLAPHPDICRCRQRAVHLHETAGSQTKLRPWCQRGPGDSR